MLPNITEFNSKKICIRNVEMKGSEHDNSVKIKLMGYDFTLEIHLDKVGANGIKIILSSLCRSGDKILPYNPANEFACYYRWAYVNGLEVPDGVYMDIHSLAGTSPAFEKLPARTQNERCGKYLDIDDDGLFVYCPLEYNYQKIWFVISTRHAMINAFSEDIKYLVFEFGQTDYIEPEDEEVLPYFSPIEKFRKLLDGVFPQNRFGELNAACYGYIYQPATDSGED